MSYTDDSEFSSGDEVPTTRKQLGGLKPGFFEHMTTFSDNEKAQVLNLLQYGGLIILPLLILLKFMKMYIPEEDPTKGSPELLVEVALQLGLILVVFFLVHKMVCYVPTYSKVEYGNLNLLHVVLPLFFLMFALDTNVAQKLNVLFDRLIIALGIKRENFENEKKENKKEGMNGGGSEFGGNSLDPTRMNIHDTQRDVTARSEQQASGVSNFQPQMMMSPEPMAANEGTFGSLF